MDDRFYSEGTSMSKNDSSNNNPKNSDKIVSQGDFSVNIKSDVPAPRKPQPKKFEVHISDFDNFFPIVACGSH